jgi:hypothetical protein
VIPREQEERDGFKASAAMTGNAYVEMVAPLA